MTKPVAIIGTAGTVPTSYAKSTDEIFAATGHNTGNLAFHHATWRLLDDEKRLFSFNFDPAVVRKSPVGWSSCLRQTFSTADLT